MSNHEIKAKLLEAAKNHVPFDGWGEATFRAAIDEAGIELGVARAVCPRGAVDLALAYHEAGDQAMLAAIGTADLTAEMGIPGQVTHPDVVRAYETVIAACQKHGKHAGMGGVYAPDAMKQYIDMGMRLILAGSEFSFMMQGARAQTSAVRALL